MQRPVIIAIVGPSGSGKTYLSKYLRSEFDIPVIVSTTTRPIREGETEGEDYFFVRSTKGYRREDMLTHTLFGEHEYFSLLSQLPQTGYCSYVVDENGVKALIESAGKDYDVFVVLVTCNTEKLLQRGIDPLRIERDSRRKQIDYRLVNVIIGNNKSVKEFEEGARDMIKILEQWRHLL